MEPTFIILGIAIVAVAIAVIIHRQRKKAAKLKEIEYRKLLQGTDKSLALKAGRDYYSYIRGGNLSIYDEQAIANDLSTMKSLNK